MSEHTETPWEVSDAKYNGVHINGTWGGSKNGASVFNAKGGFALDANDNIAKANALHIVHCVNNHERLVEALKACVSCFNCPEWSDRCEESEQKARELLAELEETK